MKKLTGIVVASLLFAGVITKAYAFPISYQVHNLSGNVWEYTYTVANDASSSFDIEEFTVFFDFTLYENLFAPTAPAGWDPIAIQPDPLLPDDGFYDALALTSGIAPGQSLNDFSVGFTWLGTGKPGDQRFDIVDPITFETLLTGQTQVSVPEPGVLLLFCTGLLVLFGVSTMKSSIARRHLAM